MYSQRAQKWSGRCSWQEGKELTMNWGKKSFVLNPQNVPLRKKENLFHGFGLNIREIFSIHPSNFLTHFLHAEVCTKAKNENKRWNDVNRNSLEGKWVGKIVRRKERVSAILTMQLVLSWRKKNLGFLFLLREIFPDKESPTEDEDGFVLSVHPSLFCSRKSLYLIKKNSFFWGVQNGLGIQNYVNRPIYP